MSDLTATNCGCGCENGMSSCLWIILLLACCGGCGNMNSGCGNGCGNDSCLWIILLLLFCGGNSFGGGCGSNCGCGC
ncbi:chorion class high-cysteine HCB protein 13 [[Ruminococcus] torques]|uniref:chorion class high-cysteine HCB protein 13 n=1 Tax=[Ruminococcus] torques TaxID=33039 RepID=UPI00399B6ADC